MQRSNQRWLRLGGALLVLCLLLPLVACLCGHDDCDGGGCSCTDCVCICHASAVVIPATLAVQPLASSFLHMPPLAWSCPSRFISAIFRPPIV